MVVPAGYPARSNAHSCHPRESGDPVRRSFAIHRLRYGILGHSLSRVMTAVGEADRLFDSFEINA
jgi:hypothetical protein